MKILSPYGKWIDINSNEDAADYLWNVFDYLSLAHPLGIDYAYDYINGKLETVPYDEASWLTLEAVTCDD